MTIKIRKGDFFRLVVLFVAKVLYFYIEFQADVAVKKEIIFYYEIS